MAIGWLIEFRQLLSFSGRHLISFFNEQAGTIVANCVVIRLQPDKSVKLWRMTKDNGPGGMEFVIRELLDAGLLHEDVKTVPGKGLLLYATELKLDALGQVSWQPASVVSVDETALRAIQNQFQSTGG